MTNSFDFSGLVRPVADASSNRSTDHSTMSVIEALQTYRGAEAAMRRRTGAAMGLGENDLLALRFILDQHEAGRVVASKDVTRYLGISSASTTVLLRRLEDSGHIVRRASTVDKRSAEIIPTPSASDDTGPLIASALRQMSGATERLTAEESRIIVKFLTAMRETVDAIGTDSRL